MTVCDGSLSWTHNTETLSTNGKWTMHHATELHWFVWRLLWPMLTLRLIIIQKRGEIFEYFFRLLVKGYSSPPKCLPVFIFPLWIKPVFPKLFSPWPKRDIRHLRAVRGTQTSENSRSIRFVLHWEFVVWLFSPILKHLFSNIWSFFDFSFVKSMSRSHWQVTMAPCLEPTCSSQKHLTLMASALCITLQRCFDFRCDFWRFCDFAPNTKKVPQYPLVHLCCYLVVAA